MDSNQSTRDSASPSHSNLSLEGYTKDDLQVLRDIIVASADASDGTSFLAVFKAYDNVLKARNIDPAIDRIYFRFLLKLARIEGPTWLDKFNTLLKDQRGISSSSHVPRTSSPSVNRSSRSLQQMIIRGSQTLPSRASSDLGIRHVMPGLSSSSRPRSVIEASHRRTPTTTQRYSLQRDPEFSISFEEDPRKYTILRQFWHVWRAKTIRRHSRLSSQTELADRHYRQMLVPLAFETWKQKWRYFAVLCRRVELDRTKTILARCLTWWRYATRLEIQRNERIHNEVVLRRMFKGWLREIRDKREEMNSVTLQHVMERWKAKASTTRDLHAMAETYNRRRILRQFWKEWFFRTCAVKTVQYYQIKLKQHTIAKWIRRARHIRVLNRHAKYIARNKVTTHTWDRWRSALDSRLSDGDLADNHWKQNSLFAAFNSWKKTLQLSLRAGLFTARINNKLLAHAWMRWRDITKVTIHATSKAELNMLRTVFKAWHDEAMVTRIENHLDKKLLSRSFSYWMLRQRGRLLERVRDHRFQQEAFDIWRERFEGICDALDSWGEQLQKANSAKIAKCFFQMWVQKLRDRDDEYEVAIVCHEKFLLRKSIGCWRDTLESRQRLSQEADHAHYYFLIRRTLMNWNKRCIEVRKSRRLRLLEDYLRRKNNRTIKRCFTYWRERTDNYRDLGKTADQLLSERNRELLQDTLLQWNERFLRQATLTVQAANHYQTHLLGSQLGMWREALGRVDELSGILDCFLLGQDEDMTKECLRIWRLRIFQLRGKTMQAELFQQRSARLKLRLIFRIWRDKLKAVHTTEIQSTSVSTIELSDRAHTAPITPHRSTRRYMWRNLNSR